MAQLILAMARGDGDYDTIAAIQNDAEGDIPALEWVLQMKEYMEHDNPGCSYVILHRDELLDVIVDPFAEDITVLCEEAFNGGCPCL